MNRTRDSRRPRAVRISSAPEQLAVLDPLLAAARAAAGDVPALLELAKAAAATAPNPGEGKTAFLWEILASVAAVDVAAGRAIEPHLDASAVLAQAAGQAALEGWDCPDFASVHFDGAWGVFAAEAAGLRLEATAVDGCFLLHGSKPWCSLAAQLDHAVVTAHLDDGGRAAFAVDLHAHGVSFEDPQWTSRGLTEIPSGTVHFDAVPAVPLGDAGWYYRRPGFAWGGMGVAACWLGGAVAVGRGFRDSLLAAADGGRQPDQLALAHVGEIDRTLAALTDHLARTAARIDAGELSDTGAWSEALRVRGNVAAAVERIQTLVSQNLGPGPLAFDPVYGKRMADLSLYIRQHHAMRDDAQLGARTLQEDHPW
ncbi:alkylation response protein AidB-like acyl-CoA dehydrogenase [Arthrobacter ginsengisoli]|uniref:Alkylation response protein AidB-like acyl-CoA dehydrogenase n=1 Tax=Arthrobacter ginsengisoli TaxID=1356565 RepID=A0ABU1U9C4_9MICC|nr:acyl-CoA dehydrogenase family protein [Arthrobacter ginsengisoli]MDR7081781.1 alkylation response protein AidB-like acyl-CoA dehydrogenase [Arthrobacter ginsengisoli]